MSYGTRKAIAGALKAAEIAHEYCLEAIRRLDAATTREDIQAVSAWAHTQRGWFFRSAEDDAKLRESWNRAHRRVKGEQ